MTDEELLIPNKIIKSKRKTISLIIKNDGQFIVRAPIRSCDNEIFKFIRQKTKWIVLKRREQINNSISPISFDKLEQINILDKQYNLIYSHSNQVKLIENDIILPYQNTKLKLISFLKKFAKQHITERAKLIAGLFEFEFNKISITSAKTCWGSCSSNNNLHFTYKLIMCPEDVVDYIILHELCHTKIKNHSKDFWLLVERCNPFYKIHEKWLKKNRAIIEII